MRISSSVLVLATILYAQTGAYGTTIYDTRGSFLSSTTAQTTISFEGLVGTSAYPQNYPFGDGHYSAVNPIVVDGVSFLGITVDVLAPPGSPQVFPDTYILSANVGAGTFSIQGSGYALLLGRNSGIIEFNPGVSAFGFDIGLQRKTTGAVNLTLNFWDGGSYTSPIFGLQNNPTFFGFAGAEVQSISFTNSSAPGQGGLLAPYLPYIILDDFVVATATVPEPSAALLLTVGVAALGLRRVRPRITAKKQ